MNEEDLLGAGSDDELHQLFTVSVSGKVVFLHIAIQLHGILALIQAHHVARGSLSNRVGRGGWIGIADEVQRVRWVGEEAAGEFVRDGVLGHHSAGKGVDSLLLVANGH